MLTLGVGRLFMKDLRKKKMKQGRLYTLRESSDYLGLSIFAIRSLVWRGEIPVVRLPGGRKQYLDRKDLDSLVERGKEMGVS